MSFQTSVALQQAPAVEGDFASANPRASVLVGEGALVTPAAGAIIGRFCWVTNDSSGNPYSATNTAVGSSYPNRQPDGFLSRRQQGLITAFLGESTMTLPPGFMMTLHNDGDYWGKTRTVATRGQKVFASLIDGGISTAAAGATIASTTGNASFATNVMTAAAPATGTYKPGQLVTSTGVAAGTYITAQTSGTAGGAGTYTLSTAPGTITSQAVTASDYVETKFVCQSAGAIGELIKFSNFLP